MRISFVTPLGFLVALVALVPLAMLFLGRSQLRVLCARLGLVPPATRSLVPAAVAVVGLGILLALAAAQPILATHSPLKGRGDASAFFVFDISRSMGARTLGSPTRLEQARRDAKALRAQLERLPVGVASITDRLLPHLFPSVSANAFNSTLDESLAIDRPTSSLPYGNVLGTSLGALQDLVLGRYFDARAKRRVAVVFTDGETLPNGLSILPAILRRENVHVLFFRYWRPSERVYDRQGRLNTAYVPDPGSTVTFGALARSLKARVFAPGQTTQAADTVRELVGKGPMVTRQRELDSRLLTPYVLLVAFVPLAFLLVRRDAGRWVDTRRARRPGKAR